MEVDNPPEPAALAPSPSFLSHPIMRTFKFVTALLSITDNLGSKDWIAITSKLELKFTDVKGGELVPRDVGKLWEELTKDDDPEDHAHLKEVSTPSSSSMELDFESWTPLQDAILLQLHANNQNLSTSQRRTLASAALLHHNQTDERWDHSESEMEQRLIYLQRQKPRRRDREERLLDVKARSILQNYNEYLEDNDTPDSSVTIGSPSLDHLNHSSSSPEASSWTKQHDSLLFRRYYKGIDLYGWQSLLKAFQSENVTWCHSAQECVDRMTYLLERARREKKEQEKQRMEEEIQAAELRKRLAAEKKLEGRTRLKVEKKRLRDRSGSASSGEETATSIGRSRPFTLGKSSLRDRGQSHRRSRSPPRRKGLRSSSGLGSSQRNYSDIEDMDDDTDQDYDDPVSSNFAYSDDETHQFGTELAKRRGRGRSRSSTGSRSTSPARASRVQPSRASSRPRQSLSERIGAMTIDAEGNSDKDGRVSSYHSSGGTWSEAEERRLLELGQEKLTWKQRSEQLNEEFKMGRSSDAIATRWRFLAKVKGIPTSTSKGKQRQISPPSTDCSQTNSPRPPKKRRPNQVVVVDTSNDIIVDPSATPEPGPSGSALDSYLQNLNAMW